MVTKRTFKFVAGSLCLDFVNTVGARQGNSVLRDKLAGFSDLVDWSRMAGVLSAADAAAFARRAAEAPRAAGATLKRALAFREALYGVAAALMKSAAPPAPDLELVNREIAAAQARRRLAFLHGKLVWIRDDANSFDRMLWSVADSASALFASPDPSAIRQCPGDECGWLFLDTSRNHSRRWCQMRICGNRAKVRRFRESL